MAVVWAGAVSKETAWVGVPGSTTLREVRWLKRMWEACPQAGALFQAREGGGPCPEGGQVAAHCVPHLPLAPTLKDPTSFCQAFAPVVSELVLPAYPASRGS